MLDPRADVRPDDDVATEPTPDEPTGRLSPGARALLDWLIVVGVAIDTMRQLEAQLMMRNYEGFIQ